jgi:hypothetical protein
MDESKRDVIAGTRRSMKELVDGTIRVQIDIDRQYKADFHRLFGEIDMPVALAPLDLRTARAQMARDAAEQSPPTTHEAGTGWRNLGSLTQSAILLCKDETFQKYLAEKHDIGHPDDPPSEEMAAQFVKDWCKVASRKDLDDNRDAAQRFRVLMGRYRLWQGKG